MRDTSIRHATGQALRFLCGALAAVSLAAQHDAPRPTAWTMRDVAFGERFLESVYRRDAAVSYQMAAEGVRATMSIAQLADFNERYLVQMAAPPATRSFDKAVIINGRLVIAFVAAFDATANAREFVTFDWERDGWRPRSYDIWPTEWPRTGYLNYLLAESNAGDIVRTLAATPAGDREAVTRTRFAGRYVASATGWAIALDGARQYVSDRSCNVAGTEQGTGATVMLWQVLDGCRLPAGTIVSAFGRVRHASARRIDLEAVRVLGR